MSRRLGVRMEHQSKLGDMGPMVIPIPTLTMMITGVMGIRMLTTGDDLRMVVLQQRGTARSLVGL